MRPFLFPSFLTAIRLLIAGALLTSAGTASAIEWGVAGVLSQQGQRLKVAVPFGTAANEKPTVVQFRVVRSAAPAGSFSPDPTQIVNRSFGSIAKQPIE